MHVANVKLSHCEAKFCRAWAKFGRVRRKTEPTGSGTEWVIFKNPPKSPLSGGTLRGSAYQGTLIGNFLMFWYTL